MTAPEEREEREPEETAEESATTTSSGIQATPPKLTKAEREAMAESKRAAQVAADARALQDQPGATRRAWAVAQGWTPARVKRALAVLQLQEPAPTTKATADTAQPRPRIEGAPWMRADHVEIARHALSELQGSGPPLVFDDGSLHRYERDGLWRTVDDAQISRVIQGFSGTWIETEGAALDLRAGDVGGATKLAQHRVQDVGFFAKARPGLVFRNGFVEVLPDRDRPVVRGHSPDHRARFAYGFDYEHGRATPRWLAFLLALFRDDADREERILLLHEFFGGALLGVATQFDQCLAMHGLGDDGKSTLLDIVQAAMPPGTCAAVPPHKMSGLGDSCDYFRALLVGKLLNVVSELPEQDILESTGFKAAVAGDAVSGRQPCKPAFTFRPRAAHVFAANKLPGVSDQSKGFWRRFIVLSFTRSFSNDPDRDPHVAKGILDSELPGIVAAFVDGGRRLLAQGHYTLPSSHAAALRAWQLRADTVRQFVEDTMKPCEIDGGAQANALYEDFKRWAITAGHRPMARNTFGERMALAGWPSEKKRDGWRYPLRPKTPGEQ